MTWQSCGAINLSTWNWQSFNTPVVGSSGQFKIRQTFNQNLIYPSGYFLFSWICSDAGRYGTKKFYFDNQHDQLFNGEVPDYLLATCLVRYGMIKLPKRASIDPQNVPRIELFEFFT